MDDPDVLLQNCHAVGAGMTGQELDKSLDERAFTFFNKILDAVVARANDEDDFESADLPTANGPVSLGSELLKEFKAQMAAAVERFTSGGTDQEAQVEAALRSAAEGDIIPYNHEGDDGPGVKLEDAKELKGEVTADGAPVLPDGALAVAKADEADAKPDVSASVAEAPAGAANEPATSAAVIKGEPTRGADDVHGATEAAASPPATLEPQEAGPSAAASVVQHTADAPVAARDQPPVPESAGISAAAATDTNASPDADAAFLLRSRGALESESSGDEAVLDAPTAPAAATPAPAVSDAVAAAIADAVANVGANAAATMDVDDQPAPPALAATEAGNMQATAAEPAAAAAATKPVPVAREASTPTAGASARGHAGWRGTTEAAAGLENQAAHELLRSGDEVPGSHFRRAVFWHWANLEYGCSANLDWVCDPVVR